MILSHANMWNSRKQNLNESRPFRFRLFGSSLTASNYADGSGLVIMVRDQSGLRGGWGNQFQAGFAGPAALLRG